MKSSQWWFQMSICRHFKCSDRSVIFKLKTYLYLDWPVAHLPLLTLLVFSIHWCFGFGAIGHWYWVLADACCGLAYLVDISHACPCPLSLGLVKCALGHWTIEVLSCAPCLVAPSLALWWRNMHLSQSGSCTTWLLSFLLNWPSR